MAAGQWNGHNHGGTHTGDGKGQKRGVYSMNGQRFQRIPHRKFTAGKNVMYVGTHKDFIHKKGTIISKDDDKMKSSRSTIKVKMDDMNVYISKNNLKFV